MVTERMYVTENSSNKPLTNLGIYKIINNTSFHPVSLDPTAYLWTGIRCAIVDDHFMDFPKPPKILWSLKDLWERCKN